ncbi:barstar family protein [Arundinibacter roseus]|uniref:Barnase inhibitor n=1 Tax=Arundinibacter roseus TaxID=2070510 RepID=A0A4R4K0S7_9BACT|nr:barstar family protein [Arundinibacter roseus]TDB60788.1 barnase inhibitor [Arundinibacter roseus]
MKSTHFLLIDAQTNPSTAFADWYIATVDGTQATSLKAFYEQLGRALDFPDYFGFNLDSLDELLNDLQWIDEEKIVIFIQNSGDWLLHEKSDGKLGTLLDLLEASAEDWKWLDEDQEEDFSKKELRILFDDSSRIRAILEEQEIPFSLVQ